MMGFTVIKILNVFPEKHNTFTKSKLTQSAETSCAWQTNTN